jgi:glycosyltransferase involved in cell wall biosynthesis
LLQGLARSEAESFVAVRPGSAAAERLRGVAPLFEIPMRGGFDPRAALALAKTCEAHAINLIDAHTSNGHALALLATVLRPGVALVVHRRVDYPPQAGVVNRWKYGTRRVDRYVAISAAIRRILLEYGLPSPRVAVVKSAVDGAIYAQFNRAAERAALARAYGVDPRLTLIGNASALTRQKDFPTLLAAAGRLKAAGAPFHIFVAGDGAERDALERQRQDAGLEHDVTFLGFIEDVPRFLSGLDVFALSSEFEGLGTVVLEAAHAGLCVVCTDVGGLPEIVTDGETGLLVPAHAPEALAAALQRVIADTSLRARLADGIGAHVRAEFSLPAMVSGNLDVYRQVLAERS